MSFIQHLHLLIPALRSSAIRPEEEELRRVLEGVEDMLGVSTGFGNGNGRGGNGGAGRARGKMNELWAVFGAMGAARDRENGDGGEREGWAVVDEEGVERIARVCFVLLSVLSW